jgi:hypothetical protein
LDFCFENIPSGSPELNALFLLMEKAYFIFSPCLGSLNVLHYAVLGALHRYFSFENQSL